MKTIKPLLSAAALLLSPMLASATPVVYTLLDGIGQIIVQVNEPDYLAGSGDGVGDQIHICNLPLSNLVCSGVYFSQEVNGYGPPNYNPFTGVYLAVYTVDARTHDPSGYLEEAYFPGANLDIPGTYQNVYAPLYGNGPTLLVAPAPEPATFGAVALALIGFGWFGRRRRQRVLNCPVG